MRLEAVKAILNENNISFETVEYKDEKEFLHHITLFPYTKCAESCKVLALVVKSNNGKTHVEIQFNENNGDFYLKELYFGAYCFELFEYQEETWAEKLVSDIKQIQKGNWTFIVADNIERNFHLWEWRYDLNDTEDEICGKKAFEEEMRRIQVPENIAEGLLGKILDRLLSTKIQYEIFDWNTYQCIIEER